MEIAAVTIKRGCVQVNVLLIVLHCINSILYYISTEGLYASNGTSKDEC